MKKLTVLAPSIFFLLFAGLGDSYADHKKNPNAGHGGGGDSEKPPEMHDLSFEPMAGPTGSGLLTIHKNNGGFDYTTRSNVDRKSVV